MTAIKKSTEKSKLPRKTCTSTSTFEKYNVIGLVNVAIFKEKIQNLTSGAHPSKYSL